MVYAFLYSWRLKRDANAVVFKVTDVCALMAGLTLGFAVDRFARPNGFFNLAVFLLKPLGGG